MLIDEDDDDKDTIPRGLVSQRRALFGNGDYQPRIRAESVPPPTSSSSSSSSSAASLSSPSSSSKKRSRSYSRPTEIRIFRYGMDESSSNSNIIFEPKNSPEVKRITVTRHVTTHITEEPQIVIENARSSSTMTTERHLLHKKPPKRVYPIVTVKVSDLPPTFMKPEQVYEPPKDYLFDPIEIPIERTYRLNSIRTSSAKPCETVPEPHPRRMKGDLPQCDPEAMNGNDGGGYKQLDNWHQFEILKKKLSTDSYDNQRHVTPDEIAEECRRMLNELQDDEEKENRIVYGRSHGQVDEEIDKLKKQVAETSDMGVEMPPPTTVLNNKQEIPDRSIIPASDTSHIISLKDQSVMYTTGAVARQEALIIRLQKELTDAQRCNHALNSQLTSLKSKNESAVTKVSGRIRKIIDEKAYSSCFLSNSQ